MTNVPETPAIVQLLRNADEQDIRQRLDVLDGERDALKTLLRSLTARRRAKERAGSVTKTTGGGGDA